MPRAILIGGLAVWLALPATDARANTVESRLDPALEKAHAHLERRDANAAVIELRNALQRDPSNMAARRLLGEIYLRGERGDLAEREFARIRLRGSTDPEITLLLAQALLIQGKHHDVLDLVSEEFAAAAHDAESGAPDQRLQALAHMLRGHAQIGTRDLDRAEPSLRRADALNPHDVRALVGLAQIMVSRGRLDEAEAMIDRALSRQFDSIEALTFKGELRRVKRDLPGAVEAFGRAIEASQSAVLARLGRAAALIDLDRIEAAQDDVDFVLARLENQPIATYLAALIRTKHDDFRGAQDLLDRAGRELDRHLPSLFLRGAVSYALEQYEQAITHLEHYRAAAPGNERAQRLLGATYLRRGEPERAADVLAPLVGPETRDPQLLTLLATAYVRAGRFADGTAMFERAADSAPDIAPIHAQLALSRLATGEAAGAIADLEKAIDLSPESQQYNILLALVRLRSSDFDGALTAAEAIERHQPDNPIADNLMGAAWLGKGDAERARAAFEAALAKKPDFHPARMNLAQLQLRFGTTEAAAREYRRVLAIDPAHVGAMTGLADVAARENRPSEVTAWLERAAAASQDAIEPRLRLVGHYAAMRDFERAVMSARALHQSVPNNPRVVEALGRAEAAAGQPVMAAATFTRLVNMLPRSVPAHNLLAGAQIAARDLDEARRTLQRALALDPDHVPARATLAEIDIAQQRYGDAMREIDQLRQLAGDRAFPDALAGDVLARQGDPDGAYAAYSAALKKEPDFVRAAIRRLTVQIARDRREEGLGELQAWVDRTGDVTARHHLASTYIQAGRQRDATREYEVLLARQPDNPVVLNNLAWLYQQQQDPRAVAYAEKALARAPDSPAVMDTLGWILLHHNGDKGRALDYLQRAHELVPNQGDIHFHYAYALKANGRAGEARDQLGKLLRSGVRFGKTEEAQALYRELGGRIN